MATVPDTIITSDWRGLARKMTPKRSKSYREAPDAIISMAQQASPNWSGQIEDRRPQLPTWFRVSSSSFHEVTWM